VPPRRRAASKTAPNALGNEISVDAQRAKLDLVVGVARDESGSA
jgi:hypothetical protein